MFGKINNPDQVKSADIVVGIPSYNEADAIGLPTRIAGEGLKEFYSDCSSVLVNVDNNSTDGTEEAFFAADTDIRRIYASTPEGVRGKGNNLRNLFQIGAELEAKAIVCLDADLKSITPRWVERLAEPLFDGYDYVVPLYTRHKYDGTITKNIAYPLLRTLYGLRVRQPIGGDFGVSSKLARCYLTEKTWSDEIAQFGIDIWMTTIALGRNFNVCQTFMGSPKVHKVKDPGKDLGPMFSQVVSTIFQLTEQFEYLWKESRKSKPSTVYGFGLASDGETQEINPDIEALYGSFQSGFQTHFSIWEQVLSAENLAAVKMLRQLPAESFYYSSDLWARILFDFAIAYRTRVAEPQTLIAALVPFYHSRTLSFVNKTVDMDANDTEEYLENINRVFEREKGYLISRWNAALKMRNVL